MFITTDTISTPRIANSTVEIIGATHVPTARISFATTHAPTPARADPRENIDETMWLQLERVMSARAASMAAHPTAQPTVLRLAS